MLIGGEPENVEFRSDLWRFANNVCGGSIDDWIKCSDAGEHCLSLGVVYGRTERLLRKAVTTPA